MLPKIWQEGMVQALNMSSYLYRGQNRGAIGIDADIVGKDLEGIVDGSGCVDRPCGYGGTGVARADAGTPNQANVTLLACIFLHGEAYASGGRKAKSYPQMCIDAEQGGTKP